MTAIYKEQEYAQQGNAEAVEEDLSTCFETFCTINYVIKAGLFNNKE